MRQLKCVTPSLAEREIIDTVSYPYQRSILISAIRFIYSEAN